MPWETSGVSVIYKLAEYMRNGLVCVLRALELLMQGTQHDEDDAITPYLVDNGKQVGGGKSAFDR